MAAPSKDYLDFIMDQLSALRGIESGRFFGGVGLSSDGVQFGMLTSNSLYFVVDATTRAKYEQMGGSCFWYRTKKGRVDVKKYYSVPADLLEDQEQLVALARESIGVAGTAKSAGRKRARSPVTKRR